MAAVRPEHATQAARLGVLGSVGELTAKGVLLRDMGTAAEPYQRERRRDGPTA